MHSKDLDKRPINKSLGGLGNIPDASCMQAGNKSVAHAGPQGPGH